MLRFGLGWEASHCFPVHVVKQPGLRSRGKFIVWSDFE
jgi:hypothetical protein